MTLYFEISPAQGAPARMVLQPGMQRIAAAVGDRYRIYDDSTGKAPPDIVVKRLDNHMIIDGLPDGAAVQLTDFYARCGVSSPCTFVVEEDAVSAAAPVEISPASPPLQALTDGSFVIYPADYSAAPAVATASGDSFPRAAAYAVGGLAIVGLAAGGGGGGGGGEETPPPAAVSPSPDAPTPVPPPAPPPDDGGDAVPGPPIATAALVMAVTDDAASRTGTVADGAATNDNTPTISGSLSAPLASGQAVQVLRNGSAIAVPVDVDGETWRVTDAVADGTYTYAARVVDAAGAGPTSAGYRVVVDTVNDKTASITAIFDNVFPGIVIVSDGGTTNDSSPTLSGLLSEPLEAGDQLQVLRDDVVISAAPQVNGRTWSFTDGGLANGDYDYNVRVVDEAGNLGRESATYDLRVRLTGRGGAASGADAPDAEPLGVEQAGAGALRIEASGMEALSQDALLSTGEPLPSAQLAGFASDSSSVFMPSSIDSLINGEPFA